MHLPAQARGSGAKQSDPCGPAIFQPSKPRTTLSGGSCKAPCPSKPYRRNSLVVRSTQNQFSTSSPTTVAACCHLDNSLNQLDQLPPRRGRRSRTDRMPSLTKIQSARPTSPSSTRQGQGSVPGPTMGRTCSTGCPENGTDFCFTVQKARDI